LPHRFSSSWELSFRWPEPEAERDALLRGLASQDEMPEVLQRLHDLLAKPGITVETVEIRPITEQGHREQVCPMTIQMKAESYHALAMILDRIARFSPIVALDQMACERSQPSSEPHRGAITDWWVNVRPTNPGYRAFKLRTGISNLSSTARRPTAAPSSRTALAS